MLGIDDKTMRQIAQMPTEHSWLAPMIEKSEDLDALESKLAQWLMEQMFPDRTKETLKEDEYQVWRIVREIYPALMENEAITMFLDQNPKWMGYLPEVTTPSEAAELEAMDVMYVPKERVGEAAEWLGKLVNGTLKPNGLN
jgi:hypothetical protein